MLSRMFQFSFVLLLAAFLFSSCEKEPIPTPTAEAGLEVLSDDIVDVMDDGTVALFSVSEIEMETLDGQGPTPKGGHKWKRRLKRCFNLVFPLTLELPDGTNVVAENLGAMRAIAKKWKEANPDSEERPKIVFPYRVQLPNDEVILLEDLMDLAAVTYRCANRFRLPRPDIRCFQLVFPVTIIFPDGTEKEVDAEDAYRAVVHRWLSGRPRGADSISIKYPFSITLNDETVITIENQEQLREVISRCRDFVAEKKCFEPTFPVTLEFPNGRRLLVNDREELVRAINLWVDTYPRSRRRPHIVFPYTVIFEDGSTALLEDREDFLRAVHQCRGDND